jgi:hypothetical protein
MIVEEQQFNELVLAVKAALQAMEEAEIVIAGLRVEVEHWKALAMGKTND